jgi:hypothetical protein
VAAVMGRRVCRSTDARPQHYNNAERVLLNRRPPG